MRHSLHFHLELPQGFSDMVARCAAAAPVLPADFVLWNTLEAETMFSQLLDQMAQRQGAAEQLKASDQMAWVGKMNNIRASATEIVDKEIIYA